MPKVTIPVEGHLRRVKGIFGSSMGAPSMTEHSAIRRLFGLFTGRRLPAALPEPSWEEVLTSPDERQSAAGYWREAMAAMCANGTLKPANSHAVLRLVTAYLIFDRVSAVNMRGGQIDVQAWDVQARASQLASEGGGVLDSRRLPPAE